MPSQQTDDFSDGTSQSSNSFTSSLLGFSKIVEMASITSDLSLDTNCYETTNDINEGTTTITNGESTTIVTVDIQETEAATSQLQWPLMKHHFPHLRLLGTTSTVTL